MNRAVCFLLCIVLAACQAPAPEIVPEASMPAVEQISVSEPAPAQKLDVAESGSSAQSTPPTVDLLPVAKVSAQYAANAQRIIDSFYSAAPDVLQDVIQVGDQEWRLMKEWSYLDKGIDQYFFSWGELLDGLRSGESLPALCDRCGATVAEFYGDDYRQVVILYGDAAGNVLGEALYYGTAEQNDIAWMGEWSPKPRTGLYLDDTLMERLKNAGLDLGKTTAQSISIAGFCWGVYFTDGETGRYLPQDVVEEGTLPVGKLCQVSELVDGLAAYMGYMATLADPITG